MQKASRPETERRRFPRIMAPVLYRTSQMLAKRKRVSNISLGGVRIYSDERLDVGQELELEFFFPNRTVVKAKARVVWIKELPPGSRGIYDVGLEFVAFPKKAREELSSVLKLG